MKKLILTVGLPRSGKTTWANKQSHPIVNRDAIRLALYDQPYIQKMENFVSYFEETMVESLFEAGHDVIIIDATHMKMEYINKWNEKYKIILKYFYVDPITCIRRAKETRKEYLIDVIGNMWKNTDIENFKNMIQYE